MEQAVSIDVSRADELASVIAALGPLPADAEEASGLSIPAETIPDFYFALVAINHQTTPIVGPPLNGRIGGEEKRGWDFLRLSFMAAVQIDPSLVSPSGLQRITGDDLKQMCAGDDGTAVLSDVDGRAALLNDLGSKMEQLSYSSVDALYGLSGGILAAKTTGLLDRLAAFRAYSDPVRKKSFYFLALMQNHRIWTYTDPENLGAPVDYHEVRGHLRTGTVRLEDSNLRERVARRELVSEAEDIQIRTAVAAAIARISGGTGENQSTLHYFFWNLFRTCCPRDADQHCSACPKREDLPGRYAALKPPDANRCLVADACLSRNQPFKLPDHYTTTAYY